MIQYRIDTTEQVDDQVTKTSRYVKHGTLVFGDAEMCKSTVGALIMAGLYPRMYIRCFLGRGTFADFHTTNLRHVREELARALDIVDDEMTAPHAAKVA